MNLLKIPLAAILMLTALTPLSIAAPISTQTPGETEQAAGLHGRYEVLYRYDHHDAWRVYGTYHSDRDAHHEANHLRRQDYQVRVHHHS